MRCIFPQAVKPWQKALCGVVGVGLLGTGLTLGFYAMRNVSHEVLGSTIFTVFCRRLNIITQRRRSVRLTFDRDRNLKVFLGKLTIVCIWD